MAHHQKPTTAKHGQGQVLQALWCAGGIVGSLAGYGLLQEHLMTQPYGDEQAANRHSLFLVLCNRLVTCAVSLLLLKVSKQPWRPAAPLHCYALVSCSNIAATTCQYEALKHVIFPLQTLGKCTKMLPVMAWSALLGKRRYSRRECLVAAAVSVGVLLFLLSGPVRARRGPPGGSPASPLGGGALLLGYVALDSFTSSFQDRLFRGYEMGVFNQMLGVNACSAGLSLLGLVVGRQLLPALSFVRAHPQALGHMFLLSLTATVGQLFILHTIRALGPLFLATVMTLRQFLSILLSALLFRHPLSSHQWGSAVFVFGVLLYSSYSKAGERKGSEKARQPGADQKPPDKKQ